MMNYNDIPAEFISIAKKHGAKRSKLNEKTRELNEDYSSPNPNKADFIGVLGEMLAALEMQKKGMKFTLNALLDEKPLAEPDIMFEHNGQQWNVDVKATEGRKKYVPTRKLDKAEACNINAYWFFKIDLKQDIYYHNFNTLDEVKSWRIIDYKEKQYCKKFV